ncbi:MULTISPECIES: 50S ribosomal protein L10 [unclassified Kaistella]|uniref:50S ribosomal protein L10 n=1 Tax=unclassified Kaistella TaxID=2762626 RepID=UPI00273279DD|nr:MULTISPECIES: 50S ribosomal protein L10 [unclassified Kaistella]MDP2452589.1 50S ribosomal protein L10 [Kaistella sp. SH11-4b]MDP2455497.1 50S ribosomal protein L10 [Kaistella sp. SH40-3]MDP2458401.1 50S ribosomal protein L10 [Kaistella sp. SH19-2b]
MTKEDKVLVIQELKEVLQDAKVVYVASLEGMNAAATSDFRRQAFKQNITVKVVKNTLLQKALEQIEGVDYSEMFPTFKGNSAIMISETANAPAKLIQGFRKKAEIPALKSAYLQETFYVGDENLATLVSIKSREEMIGEIITLLQSPLRNVLSALQNKDEANGDAEEAAPVAEEVQAETPAAEVAPEASADATNAPSAE